MPCCGIIGGLPSGGNGDTQGDGHVRRRTKILGGGAVVTGLALGGGATAFGAYYQDRALPGTTVAGLDIAGMTRDQVATQLQRRAQETSVEVTTPQGTKRLTLAQLGMPIDVSATVSRAFAPNEEWSAYAKALVEPRSINAVAATADATLDALSKGLSSAALRPATDATVALAVDKKSFGITPAVAGRSLDTAPLRQAAAEAASSLTSATVTLSLVEQPADVSTSDAQEVADQANAIIAAPVEIKAGSKTFTASPGRKASWVSVPSVDGQLARPAVDEAKVGKWVTQAADSVKVEARNGMRYLNYAGKTLRVITAATDGVEVSNADDVAKDITAALNTGAKSATKFRTKTVNATWTERRIARGAEGLAYPAVEGEKWIDVNLSRHTMTAFVGGRVALGPIQMVNGAPATPTDIGTFHIYWKNPLMTMRGQNADGTDYETPDVPWSSFFNGGEALHGAYWRKTWGYAASHGCINLPIPTAKWVYDWAPMGTPVVTHN